MIALVDYGAGNLTSVRKALAALGAEVVTPRDPDEILRADGIIVPGVGHFAATRSLDAGWRDAIRGAVDRGAQLLGICLGMQWLFEGSTEAPGIQGLGLFRGVCDHLERAGDAAAARPLKIPHVGWNSLRRVRDSRLLAGVRDAAQVYFTHSYVAPVTEVAAAVTCHGVLFAAAVEQGRVAGVQFHPEKSGDTGLRILANWLGGRSTSAPDPLSVEPLQTPAPRVSKRIIACLDVRDGRVVKGVNFESLRSAGEPAALAARYNREGIDEIVILDVTATLESRQARAHTVRAVAREIFLPLTVGGGIRTEDDAGAAIEAGADKVSLNSAALADPTLITRLARRYGSQAVIVAIDARRAGDRFDVYARSGTDQTTRDAVEWAREAEACGAGEILLTSIDRDGTRSGFDCGLTAAVSDAVPIPVIASGGAGEFSHFADVFTIGHADAALAASIFHYNEKSVGDLKRYLQTRDIPTRLVPSSNSESSEGSEAQRSDNR